MKKLMMLALVLMLAASAGFADGSTWTNPDELMYFGNSATPSVTLPRSMISAVSNGIWYDEVDTLILSPALLSNYEGYSLFTGYGNYEYDYIGGTDYPNNWLKPFGNTVAGNDTVAGGNNVGKFLLGATGKIMDYRSGAIGSFEFGNVNRLDTNNDAAADDAEWSKTDNITVDADVDGTADFAYSNTQSYTDYNSITEVVMGAGTDLGFLGASLFGSFVQTTNHVGGNYTYTKALNADTDSAPSADPNSVITSRIHTFGYGEAGKAKNNPYVSGTDFIFGARAHYPMELMDISMPVKGEVYFGSETPDISATVSVEPQATFAVTATNVGGTAADTSTLTATYGDAALDGTFSHGAAVAAGGFGAIGSGLDDFTPAEFAAIITQVEADDYAYDPENSTNMNFKTGLKGLIDPEFILNEVFSVRTRGQVGYEFDTTAAKLSAKKSVTYNQAIAGQTTPGVYSYSSVGGGNTNTIVNTIGLELGGIMDLHNREKTLSAACGLFYAPAFEFTGVKTKDSTLTTIKSWNDPSVVNDVNAVGQNVTFGGNEGVETVTQTTVYADDKVSSKVEITNSFYIPVATKIVFAKGHLELINGYLLKHDTTYEKTTTYGSTSTSVTDLKDTNGTAFNPTTTSAGTTTTETTNVVLDNNSWSGQLKFMLRWNVMEGFTLDFYGDTIAHALDFDIFGSGGGFNPGDFVNELGISATIRAK